MQASPGRRFAKILATIAATTIALVVLTVSLRAEQVQSVVGEAKITGPNEVVINGGRFRLYGVSLPARTDQQHAFFVMSILLRQEPGATSCTPRGVAPDGAALAVCRTASGRDLGETLIAAGLATSDPAVALYDNAHDRAHALGLGVWRR